jgi:hypothetical protein
VAERNSELNLDRWFYFKILINATVYNEYIFLYAARIFVSSCYLIKYDKEEN